MLSEEIKNKLDSLFPYKTTNSSDDINKLVSDFHKACKIQARMFYPQKNQEKTRK